MMNITNQIKKVVTTLALFGSTIFFNQSLQIAVIGFYLTGSTVSAEEQVEQRKTRKTPAMRERIYSQLARAQKLADEKKIDDAIAVLDRVKSRINQINSYEKAMLWNFYGFIYYGNSDTKNAILSFEKVVAQENIPESLELSTLFSLAQLSMVSDNHQQALNYIRRWAAANQGKLNDNALMLKANAYYALRDYQSALKAVSAAVSNQIAQAKVPKENWLVLKRALHYELKQDQQIVVVSEQLVRHYSKAKYWIELANMYGEVEQTEKQLAVMEAAYQQGFVTRREDVQTLAQLYFNNGAPYKSADLLSESIKSGLVLENIKILSYLAQAWLVAKETEKAVPVLERAASMSKSGNFDLRLAQSLLDLEQWSQVVNAANRAKQKGNLDNDSAADMVIGIAYFNMGKFPQAIKNFAAASKDKKQKRTAEQWLKYSQTEKSKLDQYESLLANAGQ